MKHSLVLQHNTRDTNHFLMFAIFPNSFALLVGPVACQFVYLAVSALEKGFLNHRVVLKSFSASIINLAKFTQISEDNIS